MATPAASHERLRAHVQGEISRDEPLANRTSVRVGGTADLFVQPKSVDDLARTLEILADDGIAWHVLGGGANTLVGDGGFRGAVLRLPNLPEVIEASADAVTVTLAAGSPITKIIQVMRKQKVTGAEFLASVPGTIGGAVTMNAGTRDGWMQRVIQSVDVVSARGTQRLESNALTFEYRRTHLPEGSVVVAATCRLPRGDVEASEATMAKDIAYRRATQPLHQPNFGSCFVNPEGNGAGRLIESVGLKGHRIGNAQISEMHANFIVNLGGAKASEARALLDLARNRVREATGIELHPEVKFVGEF
ncbi:MAG: UDP-N-acetylmuramate dehydrogenase [Deltaproteobacteria bacterium]|nr:UDP-N-acetylmuramate dehydrogenase [Deltaproteobacteria bacterium]